MLMRKITLFFMSLFLVLGTAMAQDDNAFALKSVTPSSDAPVSRVDYIQLTFTKDVTVKLPQETLFIKGSTTGEEFKISNAMAYGSNAIFYVEKVAGTSKTRGKDDEPVTFISTPDTYTFTIPAGVIKSVDNEEFAGQTFTFSILGTFSVASYSPAETTSLEKIELTFDTEITEVKMPASGMVVADFYYTNLVKVKKDAVISEDKKTVTLELEKAITAPGQYFLDIYSGVFIGKDGINDNASLSFNVIDPTPSFVTNYENGSRVEAIGDLEITFNNVKEVKLVENGPKVAAYLPGGGDIEGTATLSDNKITVSFGQLTEQGEYVFVIPAGMFTMDGVPNEVHELTITLFTLEITPLEIVSITPEADSVAQLDRIVIKFNQPVTLSYDENWWMISQELLITCGDKEYTLTYNPGDWSAGLSDELVYLANAEWTGNEYKSTPITEPGTYSLDLSDLVVDYAAEEGIDEWGYPATIWHAKNKACSGIYTWTVTGETNVERIKLTEGNQEIYDLLGRRIEKITAAGIYIVNGKKVILK